MTAELPSSLLRARLQLMLRHPYLASAVARYQIRDASEEEWCKTMATDGYNIFVNPKFIDELSEEETMGVLAHEVLHCILGHLDRRGRRKPYRWNVAIDHATNLFLLDVGFVLPKGALCHYAYRGLTAEEIYRRLPEREIEGEICPEDGELGDDANSSGGFDRHLESGDVRGSRYRGDDFPTDMERRRLRAQLSNELRNNVPGRIAGLHSEEIALAARSEIPWEAILTRFFNGLRQNDYRMYPFNRKHLWRGLLLPSVGAPGPDHLLVAIDTSGSMDQQILSSMLAEIDKLRGLAACSMTLIQCDYIIQEIKSYDPWETSADTFKRYQFKGRGGTSLKPPFEWLISEYQRKPVLPDALIYMTDGYGDFPDQQLLIPCLWVVPEHGLRDFPFGEVLRIGAGTRSQLVRDQRGRVPASQQHCCPAGKMSLS